VWISRAESSAWSTKGGRRREVPMRQEVYALFTALPEPVKDRVGRRQHPHRRGDAITQTLNTPSAQSTVESPEWPMST
jgi:hypothetical protein